MQFWLLILGFTLGAIGIFGIGFSALFIGLGVLATRRRVNTERSAAIAAERRQRIWRQEQAEYDYGLRQRWLDSEAADVVAYRTRRAEMQHE